MSSPEVNGTTRRRHQWKRERDGSIDEYGWESDPHHGPQCAVCHATVTTCCDRDALAAIERGTYESDEDDWCDGPRRYVWRLPEQPRPEVVAILDDGGRRWERVASGTLAGTWVVRHPAGGWVELSRRWQELVAQFGPLTEVSEAYDAWLAEGEQP